LHDDIPFVYRYNLPEAAQQIFRSVYRETLRQHGSGKDDTLARECAIAAVKERFTRDGFGTWRRRESEG
jgi:cation transport regulator ChaB